jgi:hypothetical protein
MFNCCESVFKVVDDALESAAKTQNKKSKDVDDKFKKAIEALGNYEKKWHSKETIVEKMADAVKEKSSSTILNRMKEKLHLKKVASSDLASSYTNTD